MNSGTVVVLVKAVTSLQVHFPTEADSREGCGYQCAEYRPTVFCTGNHGGATSTYGRALQKQSYPHPATKLKISGVEFPMKLVYDSTGPLYCSKDRKVSHIYFLYIENNAGDGHYCYIKHSSRLVVRQLSEDCPRRYLCDWCLKYFSTLKKTPSILSTTALT